MSDLALPTFALIVSTLCLAWNVWAWHDIDRRRRNR